MQIFIGFQKVFKQNSSNREMGNKRYFFIILIVCIFIIIAYFLTFQSSKGDCEIKEIRENPISLELAQRVAKNQIQSLEDPSFNWTLVGYIQAYDIYGNQEAYVNIFRKESYSLDTLEKLEARSKLFSDSTTEESDGKYQFNDVATVIVSVWKEDKILLRHYRGLPDFFVDRQKIKDFIETRYPGKTLGKSIAITPVDFKYEIVDENSKRTGEIIGWELKTSSIAETIARMEKNAKEKYSKFSDEQCKQIKEALSDAKNAQIAVWNKI